MIEAPPAVTTPLAAKIFTVALGAVLVAIAVNHQRQIRRMRAWSAAHGLPLAPPASRMRLARALEAQQPVMTGLWDGLWVRLWTRPVWLVSSRGIANGWKVSIRVVAERDLRRGTAPSPEHFGHVAVDGRELLIAPWGGVPMDDLPRYLSEAVAYARSLAPPA
jgi:hypothetical protein